jgi:hypothetical protein
MSRTIILLITILSVREVRSQWVLVPSGITDSLTAITAIDGAFYVAGVNGVFLRSFDGGNGFDAMSNTPTGPWNSFTHLTFFDDLEGFASNPEYPGALHRTTDGGQNWFPFSFGNGNTMLVEAINSNYAIICKGAPASLNSNGILTNENLVSLQYDLLSTCCPPSWQYDIVGIDTVGYFIGSIGWILTTIDRGNNIESGSFPESSYLVQVEHISGDTVVIRDIPGRVYFSYNRGLSWQTGQSTPGWGNSGMGWLNSELGFVFNDNGEMYNTINAGQSWTQTPTPTPEHLNDIHFINDQQGWAVGENGTIIASIDGGQSWFLEESGVNSDLLAIASDDQAVIIVGHDGIILRRDLTVSAPEITTASQIHVVVDRSARSIRVNSQLPVKALQVFDLTGREHSVTRLDEDFILPSSGLFICHIHLADGTSTSKRIVMP